MKIAVPINAKRGLESEVAEHFGRADNFLIYDTEIKKFDVYPNPEATGGSQFPPDFLHSMKVDAVIVFSLGPMAYNKFKDYRIKMCKAIPENILKNIKEFEEGNLGELTEKDIF